MTIKYNNVYIEDAYTICGNYENDGPLADYFDKNYEKDLYFGEKSWEKAETYLLKEANRNILEKNKYKDKDIDLLISGDLQNHILIKENIYAGTKVKLNYSELANIASEKERNASECEKQAVKMKIAEYMSNHIGEEYEGIITSMQSYGFYVELPNLIEGLVSIDSLDDDNYEFDREKFIYKGRTTKHVYRLGDKVKIRVKKASKENKIVRKQTKSKSQQQGKMKMDHSQ